MFALRICFHPLIPKSIYVWLIQLPTKIHIHRIDKNENLRSQPISYTTFCPVLPNAAFEMNSILKYSRTTNYKVILIYKSNAIDVRCHLNEHRMSNIFNKSHSITSNMRFLSSLMQAVEYPESGLLWFGFFFFLSMTILESAKHLQLQFYDILMISSFADFFFALSHDNHEFITWDSLIPYGKRWHITFNYIYALYRSTNIIACRWFFLLGVYECVSSWQVFSIQDGIFRRSII